jgi:hypothetical protein
MDYESTALTAELRALAPASILQYLIAVPDCATCGARGGETPEGQQKNKESGGGAWTRTTDLRIMRTQESYEPFGNVLRYSSFQRLQIARFDPYC